MSVQIVGAGVIGLTTAYFIKQKNPNVDIEIIARELPKRTDEPGDEWVEGEWASPFAGAIYFPTMTTNKFHRQLQMQSYHHFWRLAHMEPLCGVEIRMMRQYFDHTEVGSPQQEKELVWAWQFMHKFRRLKDDELPQNIRGISGGVEYLSLCINPWFYLPWLRTQLEDDMQVRFTKKHLNNMSGAAAAPVVINATGLGAGPLVNDPLVQSVKGQTIWTRSSYQGPMAVRTGLEYTYVIPRAFSKGIILGGYSSVDDKNMQPDNKLREDIIERTNDLCPEAIENAKSESTDSNNISVIRDIVALRPGRQNGPRIQVEKLEDGTSLIHAYGFEGAGYIYSGGVGAYLSSQALAALEQQPPPHSKL